MWKSYRIVRLKIFKAFGKLQKKPNTDHK